MKKFFKKKAVKVTAVVIFVFLCIVGGCNIVFVNVALNEQYGTADCYEWSPSDTFDMEDTECLDMGSDDFKVLCLTDIHIRNQGTFASSFGVNLILDGASRIQLKKLINRERPDLIVITGDTVLTAWNDIEMQNFSDFMDSFQIPWAHVYGNHDLQGRADKAKLSEILLNSEYGLFSCGPEGMNGMGNYIVNLQRDEKTVYSLFMMDDGESRIVDGRITDGGINSNMISWYEWAVNGINQTEGYSVPNMAFMHIPIPEYKGINNNFIMGSRNEDSYTAVNNEGFFNSFKAHGGTNMFAGHDHINNFIADYNGVKLCYLTKSSYNCYFSFDELGAVTITFDKSNTPELSIVEF